jgi:hypothetical protein
MQVSSLRIQSLEELVDSQQVALSLAGEEKWSFERKMRDVESAATCALDVLIHEADREKERRQCEKETKIYLLQAEKEERVELEQLLLKSEDVIMEIERKVSDLHGATMAKIDSLADELMLNNAVMEDDKRRLESKIAVLEEEVLQSQERSNSSIKDSSLEGRAATSALDVLIQDADIEKGQRQGERETQRDLIKAAHYPHQQGARLKLESLEDNERQSQAREAEFAGDWILYHQTEQLSEQFRAFETTMLCMANAVAVAAQMSFSIAEDRARETANSKMLTEFLTASIFSAACELEGQKNAASEGLSILGYCESMITDVLSLLALSITRVETRQRANSATNFDEDKHEGFLQTLIENVEWLDAQLGMTVRMAEEDKMQGKQSRLLLEATSRQFHAASRTLEIVLQERDMVGKRTEEGLEDMWQQMGYLESIAVFMGNCLRAGIEPAGNQLAIEDTALQRLERSMAREEDLLQEKNEAEAQQEVFQVCAAMMARALSFQEEENVYLKAKILHLEHALQKVCLERAQEREQVEQSILEQKKMELECEKETEQRVERERRKQISMLKEDELKAHVLCQLNTDLLARQASLDMAECDLERVSKALVHAQNMIAAQEQRLNCLKLEYEARFEAQSKLDLERRYDLKLQFERDELELAASKATKQELIAKNIAISCCQTSLVNMAYEVGSVKEELEEMEKKLVSAQSDSEDMLAAISTDLDVVIKSTAELQETLTAALSAIVNVSEACRQGTEKIEREKDAELAELKKQLVVAEAETAVVTAAAGDGEEMEALVAELDKLKETMEALEWQLAASNAQLQAVFPHQPNFISFFN